MANSIDGFSHFPTPNADISTGEQEKNEVIASAEQVCRAEAKQKPQIQFAPVPFYRMMVQPQMMMAYPQFGQLIPVLPTMALPPQALILHPFQMNANLGVNPDIGLLPVQPIAANQQQQQQPVVTQPIQNTPKSVGQRGPYKIRAVQIPEVTYKAEKVAALCGRHKALLYRFEEKAYSFMFKRQNKNGLAVYVCSDCKRQFNKEIKISAKDDLLLEDPTKIPHLCQPQKWSIQAAKRKMYATTQALRSEYVSTTPKEAFEKMKSEILNDPNINNEEKQEVCDDVGNLKKHRRAFSRAINRLRPKKTQDPSDELDPESDPQDKEGTDENKEAQSPELDLPDEIASAPATPANHHTTEEDASSAPHTI